MLNSVKRYIRERAGGYMEYRRQIRANGKSLIPSLNRWSYETNDSWLRDFIMKRGLMKDSGKSVAIGSVYGPRAVLGWSDADIRIFFSGENLHLARWSHYADHMLSGPNPFDLGLGFDCFEDDHYLRFPLWIMYLFQPDASEADIRRICNELRFSKKNTGEKYCSLISRWDPNGVRGKIYEAISPSGKIDCPSDFMHNDDSLKNQFEDNKIKYLRQYRFNICPENSNAMGYTTEKIFESISAGCVPVYYGSMGCPEPEIINQDAILLWNENGDNSHLVSLVNEFERNHSLYSEFAAQPRLIGGAEDWITEKFADLERKLLVGGKK